MSKIHLTKRGKFTSIQQNRKYRGRAHSRNDKRPKHGDIEIIHAAIVGRLLRYMRPELGNLSWVSHETIAKELGINRTTVRAHLEAAVILGEVRVRYSDPTTAHIRSSGRYPHYTEYTGGKTFTRLAASQDGKPKRLNFYTIDECHTLETTQAYPDWMIEVIRLCASKNSKKIAQAKELARVNKPPRPKRKQLPKKPWLKYIKRKPAHTELVEIITECEPQTATNDTVRGTVEPPEPLRQTATNDTVRGTEPLLPKKEDEATPERGVASVIIIPESKEENEFDIEELLNLIESIPAAGAAGVPLGIAGGTPATGVAGLPSSSDPTGPLDDSNEIETQRAEIDGAVEGGVHMEEHSFGKRRSKMDEFYPPLDRDFQCRPFNREEFINLRRSATPG